MAAVRKTVVEKTSVDQTSDKEADKARDYSAIYQTIYLIFGIINGLLFIRFIFRLTGANPASLIVGLIYSITDIFMVPFNYIFPVNTVEGATFEWSVLVAITFYFFFSWVINRVIGIIYTADND